MNDHEYIEAITESIKALLLVADANLSDKDMSDLVFKIIKTLADMLRIGD